MLPVVFDSCSVIRVLYCIECIVFTILMNEKTFHFPVHRQFASSYQIISVAFRFFISLNLVLSSSEFMEKDIIPSLHFTPLHTCRMYFLLQYDFMLKIYIPIILYLTITLHRKGCHQYIYINIYIYIYLLAQ